MARRQRQNSKIVTIVSSLICFIVGFVLSVVAVLYVTLPDSYAIPPTEEVLSGGTVLGGDLDVDVIKSRELSIHFLELGNKYTGDCTLIKVGDTEILIDAGSRADSIPTIKGYLDQYVKDGKLEYVIVTHAHQDHYAGFATSESTDSLFDLYKVETVIQFACATDKTKQSKIYGNYQRELAELQERCNTQVYTALDCVNKSQGAQDEYDLGNNVKLQILDQMYYHEVAKTENDHSVCCQIVQNDKYYLFTGDLEKAGEQSLVACNQGKLHQVELYKAGHHGSKTSSNEKLLSVIQPKNVCVCCCAGSSEYTTTDANQFPTQDFIDRVSKYTTQIFVTTLCVDYKAGVFESMNGNIVVCANQDDAAVKIYCAHNATILQDTEWFKAHRTVSKLQAA